MATVGKEALAGIAVPFGRDVIERIIPHRDPFLFVDEVLELEPGVGAVARWSVRGDEWFLRGHFPGRPIVPGVVMVEALAQTSAIAVLTVPENHGRLLLFAGIDRVRFKRIVGPGDELTLRSELGPARSGVGKATVEARVGGALALRGLLMCATE